MTESVPSEGVLFLGKLLTALTPPMPSKRAAREALPLVERAAALVGRTQGWTRGAFARDSKGVPVPIGHRSARRFCLTGAVLRAYLESGPKRPFREPSNEKEWWTELRPFPGTARLQAALWALSQGSLIVLTTVRPAAELFSYLAVEPDRLNSAFTRMSEPINDSPWMTAARARLIVEYAQVELSSIIEPNSGG